MNGAKTWCFKFNQPDGREGLAIFGSYPALGLRAARERRAEALTLLAQGVDPMEHARQQQAQAAAAVAGTFRNVALDWHTAGARKWSEDHAAKVLRHIEQHLFLVLGDRHVAELKVRDLLAPLKTAEKNDHLDLASLLRQYIDGIMRYSVQHGLILLVFIRSSELRFARWDEIDFDRGLWTIPAEREAIEGVKHAKMRTPHLVPLSRQALALLKQIRGLTRRYPLVFPGDHYHYKPMSENAVNAALRRMGYDTQVDVCGHGFRTMACSALVESGLWSKDAVERQMSHQERNAVRAAYIYKAEHLDERRLMV